MPQILHRSPYTRRAIAGGPNLAMEDACMLPLE